MVLKKIKKKKNYGPWVMAALAAASLAIGILKGEADT